LHGSLAECLLVEKGASMPNEDNGSGELLFADGSVDDFVDAGETIEVNPGGDLTWLCVRRSRAKRNREADEP